MIYNNVTDTLRAWCDDMTKAYWDAYERERGNSMQTASHVRYKVTSEMSYKLGSLIDRAFCTYEDYGKAVTELLSLRIGFVSGKDLSAVERYHIRTVEQAFCEYFASLSPDCPLPHMPYRRQIWGEEAEQIAEGFYKAWGYDTNYWFPLNGMPIEDKLFVAPKYADAHWAEILQALGLPEQRIYEYGEPWYAPIHCVETDTIEDCSGSEIAYCPKDFSWIVYFSHENTVAFAGTIVPRIKEILRNEQAHWNRFEWDD